MILFNIASGFWVGYPVRSFPVVWTIVCHHTSVGTFPSAAFSLLTRFWGHIGDSLNLGIVEDMLSKLFGVHQNCVVLCGPFLFRATAVVVRPDNFVHEVISSKY